MNANLKSYMIVAQSLLSSSRASPALCTSPGFHRTKFLQSLVRFVCRRKMPFNIVTWLEFRDLFSFDPLVQESPISRYYDVLHSSLSSALDRTKYLKSLVHTNADLWSRASSVAHIDEHINLVRTANRSILEGLSAYLWDTVHLPIAHVHR
jgi:hypothetical protein